MTKPKGGRLSFLLQHWAADGTVTEERFYAPAERAVDIAVEAAAKCEVADPASTITVTDKDTGVVLYAWHGPDVERAWEPEGQ